MHFYLQKHRGFCCHVQNEKVIKNTHVTSNTCLKAHIHTSYVGDGVTRHLGSLQVFSVYS